MVGDGNGMSWRVYASISDDERSISIGAPLHTVTAFIKESVHHQLKGSVKDHVTDRGKPILDAMFPVFFLLPVDSTLYLAPTPGIMMSHRFIRTYIRLTAYLEP